MSAREEILGLIENMGNMLKSSASEGLEDPNPGIPVHPYTEGFHRGSLYAMDMIGDLIQDWARGLLNGDEIIGWMDTPCPYTHSHTRHWCGYKECRDS